jgi:hypothetical protein
MTHPFLYLNPPTSAALFLFLVKFYKRAQEGRIKYLLQGKEKRKRIEWKITESSEGGCQQIIGKGGDSCLL